MVLRRGDGRDAKRHFRTRPGPPDRRQADAGRARRRRRRSAAGDIDERRSATWIYRLRKISFSSANLTGSINQILSDCRIPLAARLPSATASTTSRPPLTQSPPAKYLGLLV